MDIRWQQILSKIQLVTGTSTRMEAPKEIVQFLESKEKLCFLVWQNNNLAVSKQFQVNSVNIYVINENEMTVGILHGNQFEAAHVLYKLYGQIVENEQVKSQLEKSGKYLENMIEKSMFVLDTKGVLKLSLKDAERKVEGWCHELELIMLESDQLQRQDEEISGPRAELIYWQHREHKFQAIQQKLQQQEYQDIKQFLYDEVSSVYEHLMEIERKMMFNYAEAKDNVVFLIPLDKHSQLLGQLSYDSLNHAIPVVMNIIHVIYISSKYFCTPDRITSLLIKVTNEVLVTIKKILGKKLKKNYALDATVYFTDFPLVLEIYKTYQSSYQLIKRKLDLQDELPKFDFSEMYIFGRLEAFSKRLTKVVEFCKIISSLEHFNNVHITGFSPILKKYTALNAMINQKQTDVLDYKKSEFDADFEFLKSQSAILMQDVSNQCAVFVSHYEDPKFILMKLAELAPFQEYFKMDFTPHYDLMFTRFVTITIPNVKLHYDKYKDDPKPSHYKDTYTIGKLKWIRMMISLIQIPLEAILKCKDFGTHHNYSKGMKAYNKLMVALVALERKVLDQWQSQLDHAIGSLDASLFVIDDKFSFYLNLDPMISDYNMEIQYLQDLGVDIPSQSIQIVQAWPKIHAVYKSLQLVVNDRNLLNKEHWAPCKDFYTTTTKWIDNKLALGIISVSWNSFSLEKYTAELVTAFKHIKQSKVSIGETLANVLDPILQSIGNLLWLDVGIVDKISLVDYKRDAGVRMQKVLKIAQDLLLQIENTSFLLQDVLLRLFYQLEIVNNDLINICFDKIINHLKQQVLEQIAHGIRQSMEDVKRFLNSDAACILIDFDVDSSEIIVTPNLVQVQNDYIEICGMVITELSNFKNPLAKTAIFKDWTMLLGNKEVQRFLSSMSVYSKNWKTMIQPSYKHLIEFQSIFAMDLDQEATKLKDNNGIHHLEMLLKEQRLYLLSIDSIPDKIENGPFLLSAVNLKRLMTNKTTEFIQIVASVLHGVLEANTNELIQQINKYNGQLNASVDDFEDVKVIVDVLDEFYLQKPTIESKIKPIEEGFAILVKYNLTVDKNASDLADSVRYDFDKLCTTSAAVQSTLGSKESLFQSKFDQMILELQSDSDQFASEYATNGLQTDNITPLEAIDKLTNFLKISDQIQIKEKRILAGASLFNQQPHDSSVVEGIRKDLKLLNSLYGVYKNTLEKYSDYKKLTWKTADYKLLNDEMLLLQSNFKKIPKQLKEKSDYQGLKSLVDELSELMPLVEQMSNNKMLPRHYERINHLLDPTGGVLISFDPDASIAPLLKPATLLLKDELEDVCTGALKEFDIEQKLQAVVLEWRAKSFLSASFKQRGNLILQPASTTEIITTLEDSQMTLASLFSNRYNIPFKGEIQTWIKHLTIASEVLEDWLAVQSLWIYLEAVFGGGDIAKQMPKEAKKFQNVDKTWCRVMGIVNESPLLIPLCCDNEIIKECLPAMMEQLEGCQKSLVGYLESKRAIFPRFYFVSDPSLLEILGQASDPHTIQPHLKSLFDNVSSVHFDPTQYDRVVAMESMEGEVVPFFKPFAATGNVEIWLGTLLETVCKSVQMTIKSAVQEMQDVDLLQIIQKYPAQIGLLCLQMSWTAIMEEAILGDKKQMQSALQAVTTILNTLIQCTTTNLTKMDRIKYETLITIQVHHRDVSEELLKAGVHALDDFEWLKQSRFYFKEDLEKCVVSITNFDFQYQCEYLGCTDRLVITPLTDRCYCTLAQAMGLNLGGSPAGPAGTGKTETTKDMGKALGKWVVVFNCSDQMDYRGLGRIYKGLAQSGCWGCFDEFNRIELPVLSVAAQQIASVLNAKKEKKSHFTFTDGQVVQLNPEVGFFITMNPGYAGRVELPENLKVYFRYVAMMVPDRQIIIKVKLAGCGFINNHQLARKFFSLYKLCEEQLSHQVHYDFGLRNILSVLRTCGSVKRSNPLDSEDTIMMRVLRDMNLSKLVDEDAVVFMGLIGDLFPGLQGTSMAYPELTNHINTSLNEQRLSPSVPFINKVIQLHETAQVRHGIMMLGPSGSGKSRIIQTLLQAYTLSGVPHKPILMNPKAILDYQMFGKLDVATNDWTDGIFSALWRKTLKRKGEHIWMILDGPVDAVWIENLNSVLDDNKTLTLANGDRLIMSPNVKLVFEVDSLRNASPATVSRCGMIYVGQQTVEWRDLMYTWLKGGIKQAPELSNLFNLHFDATLLFVETLHPRMVIPPISYFTLISKLVTSLLVENDPEHSFVFAMIWGFGSLLDGGDRDKLNAHLAMQLSALPLPSMPISAYFLVANQWTPWQLPQWTFPSGPFHYSDLFVPNVDSVRNTLLVDLLMRNAGTSVMLIGEPGSAKSCTIKGFMVDRCSKDSNTITSTMSYSSATTPMVFQRGLEAIIEKRLGTTYGPPGGKKALLFIDDVNMPFINNWGDQPTAEITRQLMEQGGMYSLDRPGEWTSVVDIQYVTAMRHPGGGRNDVPNRLKRQFCILNCPLASTTSIDTVFGQLLGGYFSTRAFTNEIKAAATEAIGVIRNTWQATKQQLLPTPDKFHYNFNLRDLSRIVQGILLATPQGISNKSEFNNLIKHEASRVLCDRLVGDKDVNWYRQMTGLNVTSRFTDLMQESLEQTEDAVVDVNQHKLYSEHTDTQSIRTRLFQYQAQYNETMKQNKLDLVLFEDAIDHICRITRILRTPCGSMVLVGVGGSGKQSLTRLSAFICNSKVFQLIITKNYNITNLLEDIKQMYRYCGTTGQSATFLFTDNDIHFETQFLGVINTMLTSGDIPGLFLKDEILQICNDVRLPMKKEYPDQLDTTETLYQYFIKRVRINLHVIMCFSPVGDALRQRSLKFPGLISGCTLDWFNKWPLEALVAVGNKYMLPITLECTDAVKEQAIQFMAHVHMDLQATCDLYNATYRRRVYLTPKSYLGFLNAFIKLYKSKLSHVGEQAQRMQIGLNKLLEAATSVGQLQLELADKEKELIIASQSADVVLLQVTESTNQAQVVTNAVLRVKLDCQQIADAIQQDKEIAEKELVLAKPALEEAANALNSIQPSHISSVRKLAKPPHLIMRIMDGVLLLQQKSIGAVQQDPERPCVKPSWTESMKLMSTPDFLQSLLKFGKDAMTEETVELVEPYIEMPDFTTEGAKKVSADVAGLACWVRAMCTYYHINKKVVPLKNNLAMAEVKLTKASGDLQIAQQQLDAKELELGELRGKYEDAIGQKQQLQDVADGCKRKMKIANSLINGLAGERERWTITNKDLQLQIGRLVGDVLVCTAFSSYCGPFNYEFRLKLINSWQMQLGDIPSTTDLSITSLMTEQSILDEWQIQGLPNDDLSVQNGIITTLGSRYPLIIDPQSQARLWISKKEGKQLVVTNFNHKYFRNHVEDAVNTGVPLLIEDVGEFVDPVLDNILEKNLVKSGKSFKVMFGDKDLDFSTGFRLYLTTKLPNPNYTPEVFAKLSVIDFTVTMRGLEEQLLGRVILREKKELEIEKAKLFEEISSNKKKIKDLEDNLLQRLSSTKGSLVDDESLVLVLENTKKTSLEVNDKLVIAADTNKKITHARDEYRGIAIRGSILYFLMSDFANVCNMYQTSLKQFLMLFDESMTKAKADVINTKRIDNILEYLTLRLFTYSTRGLYEKHKLMFSLLLSCKIDLNRQKMSQIEFNLFIRAGQLSNSAVKKPYSWISDTIWLNLTAIQQLQPFQELINNIENNEKTWKAWYENDTPEHLPVPNMGELSVFHHMLLIRCFCIDKVLGMARKYIGNTLGDHFVQAQILDLQELMAESNNKTPMIALLSQGSDPTSDIENLSKQYKIPLSIISMGQGQEVHARKYIKQSQLDGGWVLLQNCHLGLPFMDELLQLLEEEQVVEGFRLWITTEQHDKFPINLLQISIKFTNEPPQGLKAGLTRTYNWLTNEQLDVNFKEYPALIYMLSVFHSIVQERRKYGSIGWIIPYEFNQADLLASIMCIQMIFDQLDVKSPIPWQTIRYMVGDVHYGGRVTNNMDRKFIQTLTNTIFSDATLRNKSILSSIPLHQFKQTELYAPHLQLLKDEDVPMTFGLSQNNNIIFHTNYVSTTLELITNIQPQDAVAIDRDALLRQLIENSKSKLPNLVKYEGKKFSKPFIIFIQHELQVFNGLINKIDKDLTNLSKVLDGSSLMTTQAQQLMDNILQQQLPKEWQLLPCNSYLLFFLELQQRQQHYLNWMQGKLTVIHMPFIFQPQSLLTSIQQEMSRNNKWALDNTTISCEIAKNTEHPPTEGLYIGGLTIECGQFDKKTNQFVELMGKQLTSAMPILHVTATNQNIIGQVPVYRTSKRHELICLLNLKWSDQLTLKGTGVVCNSDLK